MAMTTRLSREAGKKICIESGREIQRKKKSTSTEFHLNIIAMINGFSFCNALAAQPTARAGRINKKK